LSQEQGQNTACRSCTGNDDIILGLVHGCERWQLYYNGLLRSAAKARQGDCAVERKLTEASNDIHTKNAQGIPTGSWAPEQSHCSAAGSPSGCRQRALVVSAPPMGLGGHAGSASVDGGRTFCRRLVGQSGVFPVDHSGYCRVY